MRIYRIIEPDIVITVNILTDMMAYNSFKEWFKSLKDVYLFRHRAYKRIDKNH